MTNKDLENIKRLIESAENNLKAAKVQMTNILGDDLKIINDAQDISLSKQKNIIEGKFDGQQMIGSDRKIYPVPVNYASKSKLVEGDQLKLTISEDGSFVFKQIGPVERKKLVGELQKTKEQYLVKANSKKYKVLTASVTYFKGKPGDQATIIIPEGRNVSWAAIEAIITR